MLAHPHVVAANAVGDKYAGQQGDQQHQPLFFLCHLEPGILVRQHLLLFQRDAQVAEGLGSVLDLLHELDASLALLRHRLVVAADGEQALQRDGLLRLGERDAASIIEGDIEDLRLGRQIPCQSLQLAAVVLLDPALHVAGGIGDQRLSTVARFAVQGGLTLSLHMEEHNQYPAAEQQAGYQTEHTFDGKMTLQARDLMLTGSAGSWRLPAQKAIRYSGPLLLTP